MFYQAKNGVLKLGAADMDYISFGTGQKNLVMVPGVGDGLKTVRGTAVPFALLYREYAKKYRVFVFSKKAPLDFGTSTRAMAADLKQAMELLHIQKASVMGISQGGMIAQYFALDYPQLVEKLVLAVTMARPNETIQNAISSWTAMAQCGDYHGILVDTAEKSYTEKRMGWYRLLYSLLGKAGKPKDLDFGRFLVQAASCLGHNAYEELEQIACPVLVIGGSNDRVVGKDSSLEIAEKIKNGRLILFDGLGHAAYEETKEFNRQVLRFLEG